ncbi:MAG TPA: hypothetical protein VN813_12230 [Luteibacter sp.]|nr:hypothetical protein [Luteibacter sp.]
MTDKLIDVYLGFMDEEVNTVLNGLLEGELRKDAAKRRPVVLIERGTVDPHGPLLEWPLERYAARPRNIAYARGGAEGARSLQAPSDPDARVESMLARAMTIFLASDDTAEAKLREANVRVIRMIDVHELTLLRSKAKLKVPLDGAGPELSVVRFDLGESSSVEPPVIVFRAPEMGLQPSLMAPYIIFLLKMISAVSSELAHRAGDDYEWPVRVSCFGAQGGASPSGKPGSISPICASLYVGLEYANGEAQPSIALCAQGGVYHLAAKSGSGVPPMPANDTLADWFSANHAQLVVDRVDVDERYRRKEESGIVRGVALSAVIAELVARYATDKVKPEVSGTSSWFIGDAQKKAFAAVGVTGCNMEDYWVIRALREIVLQRGVVAPGERGMEPVLARGFVTRVNADPLEIEPAVAEAFQNDLRRKRLNRRDYVDLLRWGLLGLPLEGEGERGMPPVAAWQFANDAVFDEPERNTFARHLYGFLVEGREDVVVPDPFFIEIATDLLKDCARLPASKADVFVEAPAQDRLEAIGLAAQHALNVWRDAGQVPGEAVTVALREFVDTLAVRAAFALDGDEVKIWLRPGKWKGVRQGTLQDARGETFGHAAVDRAFYKASNLVALRENTPHALRK